MIQGYVLIKKYPIDILLSSFICMTILLSFNLSSAMADQKKIKLLILGDSISAGLGVEPEQAYPFLVQSRLINTGFTRIMVISPVLRKCLLIQKMSCSI